VASTLLAATACAHHVTCTNDRVDAADNLSTNKVDKNDTNKQDTNRPRTVDTNNFNTNKLDKNKQDANQSDANIIDRNKFNTNKVGTDKTDANQSDTNVVDIDNFDTSKVGTDKTVPNEAGTHTHRKLQCAAMELWSSYFETFLSESESESKSESESESESDIHGSEMVASMHSQHDMGKTPATQRKHSVGMVASMHREAEGRHALVLLAALTYSDSESDSRNNSAGCMQARHAGNNDGTCAYGGGSVGLNKWNRCACCVRLFSVLCAVGVLRDTYGHRLRGYADLVEVILLA
jgi:hypothetical protein